MKEVRFDSGLTVSRDDENEGALLMHNAKTISRYIELYDAAIDDCQSIKHSSAFDEFAKRVKQECDPQEVYCYEFNNYECMLSWDGDEQAIRLIIDYYGVETARTVRRWNALNSIDYILTPDNIKHTWAMLGRLKNDCDYYLSYGNRNAKVLWAYDERKQIEEMRKRLASLPDGYKPHWIDEAKICEYEKQMITDNSI